MAGGNSGTYRVHNGSSGMKVRFAEFEMNDGATGALEFLGARINGQRAFAVQLGNAGCNLGHRQQSGKMVSLLSRPWMQGEIPTAGFDPGDCKHEKEGAHNLRPWIERQFGANP